jgi:hypothetical protein
MAFYTALTLLILAYWLPHISATIKEISQTNNIPFEELPWDLGGLALVVFVGSQIKRSWDQRHQGGNQRGRKKRKRTIDDNIKVPK